MSKPRTAAATDAPPMTPTEARAAFNALALEISPNAEVYVSLARHGDLALHCSVYPEGMVRGPRDFTVSASTFEDLLSETRAKWSEHSAEHIRRRVVEMALEIIRITAEHGECTDAALRAEKFRREEVERYGADACAKAAEMARKGPFTIIALGGANAAAA